MVILSTAGIQHWDGVLVEDLWFTVMQHDNVSVEWLDRQPIGSIFQSIESLLHLHLESDIICDIDSKL